MTNNGELPDTRFGAGLLTRLEGEDTFVLPVRDDGPIAMPKRVDGQMGVKERDEAIEEAQAREGTEETAFVMETEDGTYLGVPSTIKDTHLEDNLIETYTTARTDESSPLPEFDGVFYVESSQEVPEGMSVAEAENGGYETGYTWEISDDASMELMNDHVVGINSEDVLEGDVSVYDIEHIETEDGAVHFDRPTVILDPTEDQVAVSKSGEIQYNGNVEGLRDHLSSEYGWDMEDPDTLATAKVQARLNAYEDDSVDAQLGEQSAEEFVNQEYKEAISQLGDAFDTFPEP